MKLLILSEANSIHTKRWVKSLSERGIDIILFSLSPVRDGFYSDLPNVQISTGTSSSSTGIISKIGYLNVIPQIKRIIREEKPDIIHAHYASSYGLLGSLVKPKNIPYIVSVWGSDVYDFPNLIPFGKQIIKYNLRKADYILSTSHVMAKETQKYTDKHIYVTPFGVDINLFTPIQTPVKEEFVIGTVKTLRPKYGIDTLIKAAALVINDNPDIKIRVDIYGEGPQKEELMKLADKLNIANKVNFRGYVDNSLLPHIYSDFSVAVSLSRLNSESFGVVAVEAMACGCPVITSDADGFTEVVKDGITGFIVPKDSPEIAAQAIQKFIDNPSFRDSMGKAGRERVLDLYDWDKNVDTMMEVYSKNFTKTRI